MAKLLSKLNHKVGASSTEQGQIDTIYPKAQDWLRFSFPESNAYLADKITALAAAGDDMTEPMDFLATQINDSSLAFGQEKDSGPEILTTTQVLDALSAVSYQDPGTDPQFTLKAALLYLLNSQNLDGGWPEVIGEPSSFSATNLVLQSFLPYRNTVIDGLPGGDIIIPTKISLGLGFLKNNQYFWGSWQDDLFLSALSYHTLISYGTAPTYNQPAIDYLKNTQSPDGSFSTPGFMKTAKAIEALAKPDIVVTDIENPVSVPNPTATLRITIRNDGYLTSEPVNLSALPPALSLKIDSQPVALDFTGLPATITFEPQSTLILEIQFNQSLFGEHNVNFKVDYQSPEFWKNNNALAKNIAFGSPEFSGPTPPTWFGASTGPGSGDVTLRWQQSLDPLRSYYAIYGSTASGQYDAGSPLYVFPPGNYAGITFHFSDPSFYNVPLYFTIVSFDAGGLRGNYSPESWARAYSNPENYRGTLSGSVKDVKTNQKIPNAQIDFYLINTFYADGSGNYSINYYPGFYLTTVYASGYYSQDVVPVQIIAQSVNTKDLFMLPINSGNYPPPVVGLHGTSGDHQVVLGWNAYSPPADFKRFDIFRSNSYFSSPSNNLLLASTTDSNTTFFTDTNLVNGVSYYYAVSAENLTGNLDPTASAIGPFRPGSAPVVSNLAASQSAGNVVIAYNLSDAENVSAIVSFQFWNGSSWQEASTTSGEGVQSPGVGKAGLWNAKQDFPSFEGQTKIKIVAKKQGNLSLESSVETSPFNLDTQNPAPPTVNPLRPKTAFYNKTFGGAKDADTSIKMNGAPAVSLSSSTLWSYPVTLQTGLNQFSFTSADNFSNESLPTAAAITYDPNYFVCGDLNGDEVLDIFDVTLLVNVAFRGASPPALFARGDINGDGKYDIFDVTLLINHVFRGGPAPTTCIGSG
ncbi:MAG: hypothetical protein HY093_03185 [Candidatus Liptonbacteria bacterium]|nr:hypothetical protein [Candidatus Liptonbacteria bacterium]